MKRSFNTRDHLSQHGKRICSESQQSQEAHQTPTLAINDRDAADNNSSSSSSSSSSINSSNPRNINNSAPSSPDIRPATHTNDSETTTPCPSSTMSAVVLDYVHDIVQDLDQGHLDRCLSKHLARDTLDNLHPPDAELASSLDAALKSIAQRQLMLQTENLRYRIAIQQQHQLLTAQHEQHAEDKKDDEPAPRTSTTNDETASRKNSLVTPEDGISTIKDSSMLDKMHHSCTSQNRSPHPPASNTNATQSTGYFCKLSSLSFFFAFVCPRHTFSETSCLCRHSDAHGYGDCCCWLIKHSAVRWPSITVYHCFDYYRLSRLLWHSLSAPAFPRRLRSNLC